MITPDESPQPMQDPEAVFNFLKTREGGTGFYFVGWAIFLLSAVFWIVSSLLVTVSLIYGIGCLFSKKWRTKTIRRYFSPYLLGSLGWSILFLILWLLDRYDAG